MKLILFLALLGGLAYFAFGLQGEGDTPPAEAAPAYAVSSAWSRESIPSYLSSDGRPMEVVSRSGNRTTYRTILTAAEKAKYRQQLNVQIAEARRFMRNPPR